MSRLSPGAQRNGKAVPARAAPGQTGRKAWSSAQGSAAASQRVDVPWRRNSSISSGEKDCIGEPEGRCRKCHAKASKGNARTAMRVVNGPCGRGGAAAHSRRRRKAARCLYGEKDERSRSAEAAALAALVRQSG